MRLFKGKSGYYYIEIERHVERSLKTKDKKIAKLIHKNLEKEFALLNSYKIIFDELKKAKARIEEHYNRIISLIENSPIQINFDKSNNNSSAFDSEETMQQTILPAMITAFGLTNVEEYYQFDGGILDAICQQDEKRIIIEFKMGSLSEQHLGQCLRYINNEQINADELWLVGENINKTSSIYLGFDKIKLFVIAKSSTAKNKVRQIKNMPKRK